MIRITIQTCQENIVSLDVRGHAEYAAHGEDIVCAGVSTVVIGLLNALDQMNTYSDCKVEENRIFVQVTKIDDEKTQNCLMTAIIQLETVQENYQNYIKITKQEV